jgi:hypothetical protein
MKTGIFFTGTGPILLLTTYESLNDSKLIEKSRRKRIPIFIYPPACHCQSLR